MPLRETFLVPDGPGQVKNRKEKKIVTSQENRKLTFCVATWLFGILFTLLKGVHINPWSVGFFDLDFLAILTGYIFLSFGPIQAGAFALGQGFFIDIFSSGLHGLFLFLYLIVFLGIYSGSLFFNLQTAKGQMIIISLSIFLKNVMLLGVLALFSGNIVFKTSFFGAAAVSIIGSGLITPLLFNLFDRLSGICKREDDAPFLEELQELE